MIPFTPVVTWFLTSKVGRTIAAGAGIALAVGIAVLKVFSAGKAAERARQDQQSLENLRSRAKTDDEVRNLDVVDFNKRLDRWVRPDREG
jgi:hypothetical protein